MHSIEYLAEVCGKDRSSRVLSSCFGETAEERRLHMEVLAMMGSVWSMVDKPYPKVLYALFAPNSKGLTETHTVNGAISQSSY